MRSNFPKEACRRNSPAYLEPHTMNRVEHMPAAALGSPCQNAGAQRVRRLTVRRLTENRQRRGWES